MRQFPNRIAGQLTVLLLFAAVLMHLTMTGTFVLLAHGLGPLHRPPNSLESLARLLDATPDAAARAQVLAAFQRGFPEIKAAIETESETGSEPSAAAGAGQPVAEREEVRLSDGRMLIGDRQPAPMRIFGPILAIGVFLSASAVFVGIWAARQIVGPLRSFAAAAETFDIGAAAPDLAESGPDEIRFAARALNRMRARIRLLVEEQTRMLSSIGHDLHTPLTRLRLRAELVEGPQSDKLLRDIGQMGAMIDAALAYLRGGGGAPELARIDLPAMLETIRDNFADLGHPVSYSGPRHADVTVVPLELERAVTNLLDNAVKYGGRGDIELSTASAGARIRVFDDGPGLSAAEWRRVTEPFERGDPSRNGGGIAGLGLGLAIAGLASRNHGGTLGCGYEKSRFYVELTLAAGGEAGSTGAMA